MGHHDLGSSVCSSPVVGGPRSIPAPRGLQMGRHRSLCAWRSMGDVGINVHGGVCWRGWVMGIETRQWSRGDPGPLPPRLAPLKSSTDTASQTHLWRVIQWGCTPHPTWNASQNEKPQENPASTSRYPPPPPAQALFWGKMGELIFLISPLRVWGRSKSPPENQSQEHGRPTGTTAAPAQAARLTLGKVKGIFSNVSDSFAVT